MLLIKNPNAEFYISSIYYNSSKYYLVAAPPAQLLSLYPAQLPQPGFPSPAPQPSSPAQLPQPSSPSSPAQIPKNPDVSDL